VPAARSTTAKPAARQRRARGSLSREEILAAARALIERDGLQGLSFPRLAKQLNAGATSLYWYFPSKDDLLAALVDEVTREMYLRLAPIGDGPWDEEIIDYYVAFRRLMSSSPVYREVFAYHAQTLFLGSRMAPHVMRSIEADLAVLVRAGLEPDEAARAFNAFSLYTRTFVLIERAVDEEDLDEEAIQRINFALSQIAADLPVVGTVDGIEAMVALDDDVFRTGLRLLVAGLRSRHPALQGATKSRRSLAKKAAR
jgi:AcrR family transcriptional regulator